jgi:cyclophilin family peptidyl-prolyl cis-trans isomerase
VPSEKRARQRAAREARLAAEARTKKRRRQYRNAALVVVLAGVIILIAVLVSGNNKKTPAKSSSATTTTSSGGTATAKAQLAANKIAVAAGCPASTATRVNTQQYSAAPPMTIDTTKLYYATVKTTAGTFVMSLETKGAPKTVNNFVFLAQKGFYHCLIFHRVIPNFMDQTGDPKGTGTGGPGYTIADENPPAAANPANQYPLGSVAMANTGQPNSGGSQWFVVAGPQGESLPATYALFGSVTSGMNVVEKINQEGTANGVPPAVTNRILSITITHS